MKKVFLLTCLLMALSPLFLSARIEIVLIAPENTNGACDGSVSLIATGTAASFSVEVLETGLLLTDIYGNVNIPDLCEGVYTIEVIPAGQTSCKTVLTAEIVSPQTVAGNIPERMEKVRKQADENRTNRTAESGRPASLAAETTRAEAGLSDQLSMAFFPNPARHQIRVSVTGLGEKQAGMLTIHNSLGQQVYTRNVVGAETSFSVDVSRFVPGVYLLSLQGLNGTQKTKRLIVQ